VRRGQEKQGLTVSTSLKKGRKCAWNCYKISTEDERARLYKSTGPTEKEEIFGKGPFETGNSKRVSPKKKWERTFLP